ncbi:MAG TPA: tetratricopeptide repeat protein [Terracidiphilus sp.]|jgi:tetratricopeptide (TPR) repeat protein
MRRWIAGVSLGLAVLSLAAAGFAQDDEAARANKLYSALRLTEALPLYEDLAKAHPDQSLYFMRLASCLDARAVQLSDPSEVKAVRTRERDAAKRAVELGETAEFVRMMSQIDPDQPIYANLQSPGKALLAEGDKAFGTGDFSTAMAKYTAAAEADPKLYEAALYAGDTARQQGDLKTAEQWFTRTIAIDPDRETAYRYWGDAIVTLSGNPMSAKEKFIDAIVAEPYSRLAWQGIKQWAQIEKAVLMAPKIERPAAPVVDSKKPNTINITIDPVMTDEKTHPGGYAWTGYSLARASFRGDEFKKVFPDEKEYRHSLKEEDTALSAVAAIVKEGNIAPEKLDESLRNLIELNDAGMLDCWILINGADQGIAQDYDAYRQQHRQLLHDYLSRFVVHGGVNPTQ